MSRIRHSGCLMEFSHPLCHCSLGDDMCVLSLATIKIFCASFVFRSLIMMCIDVVFFVWWEGGIQLSPREAFHESEDRALEWELWFRTKKIKHDRPSLAKIKPNLLGLIGHSSDLTTCQNTTQPWCSQASPRTSPSSAWPRGSEQLWLCEESCQTREPPQLPPLHTLGSYRDTSRCLLGPPSAGSPPLVSCFSGLHLHSQLLSPAPQDSCSLLGLHLPVLRLGKEHQGKNGSHLLSFHSLKYTVLWFRLSNA